jgi:hypothetical protein
LLPGWFLASSAGGLRSVDVSRLELSCESSSAPDWLDEFAAGEDGAGEFWVVVLEAEEEPEEGDADEP